MIKAVIFDMDGVISDTQKLHSEIESELLKEYKIKIEADEITKKFSGVQTKEFFKELFNKHGVSLPQNITFNSIIKEKWKRLMILSKNNIQEIPGSIGLINKLKKHNFKLGIASASPTRYIELVLSNLKINQKFDTITSAQEVEKGKPNPAVFLLAAKKLNLQPENCIVIEDGISGMIAAKRADMKCIGLVKKLDYNIYPASLLINNLQELTIEKIRCMEKNLCTKSNL